MTHKDIADVIDLIGSALTTDATFLAFCQAQFAKAPAVYIGVDEQDPPPESAYPVAAVTDVREISSVEENRRTFEIDIGFGVVNTEKAVNGNRTTFSGFIQAERFREAGELAILRALQSVQVRFAGDAGRIHAYPTFVSYTTLTVEEVASRRSPRF